MHYTVGRPVAVRLVAIAAVLISSLGATSLAEARPVVPPYSPLASHAVAPRPSTSVNAAAARTLAAQGAAAHPRRLSLPRGAAPGRNRPSAHGLAVRPHAAAACGTSQDGLYYRYDVVDTAADSSPPASALKKPLGFAPSINDRGAVAYLKRSSSGNGIYVCDAQNGSRNIDPKLSGDATRAFGDDVQINNSNKVVSYERDSSSGASLIRKWDANPVDNSYGTLVAKGPNLSDPYNSGDPHLDAVFAYPTINNLGQEAFAGYKSGADYLVTGDSTGNTANDDFYGYPMGSGSVLGTEYQGYNAVPMREAFRPQFADNGEVLSKGGNAGDPLALYHTDGASLAIDTNLACIGTGPPAAGSACVGGGFTNLGLFGGISKDGSVVAFAGTTALSGTAIYVDINTPSGWQQQLIAGGQWNSASNACNKPELGYDNAGKALCYQSIDLNSRVSVIHIPLSAVNGGTDPEDNYVISFMGTPNASSRADSPATPAGKTPFFTGGNDGLWTIRLDAQHTLCPTTNGAGNCVIANSAANRVYHTTSPLRVAQIGDKLGSGTIDQLGPTGVITVGGQLANAATDDAGNVRTQRRGDHRIVFWAEVDDGAGNKTDLIVRASHLDSAQDGLLDHWKTDGLDVNGGGIDLNLAAMGATVGKRDIFMEIDWTNPDSGLVNGVPMNVAHTDAPADGVTKRLADLFAAAPALSGGAYGYKIDPSTGAVMPPDDIPAGIVLHIDAGAGKDSAGQPYSQNMGAGPLQGGDLVHPPGSTTTHVDAVYFGLDGSLSVPGLQALSFDYVKSHFFSTTDKDARELAFHYVVLTDFQGAVMVGTPPVPLSGSVTGASTTVMTATGAFAAYAASGLGGYAVKITAGKGAGQVRNINFNDANSLTLGRKWSVVPDGTSAFVVLEGSSGLGEVGFYNGPDNTSVPGNDNLMSLGAFGVNAAPRHFLANACTQWRTLAHELGHTLGLRHGGADHNAFKDGTASPPPPGSNVYLSLMSYSWQLDGCSPLTASAVQSYAGPGDNTFNDWANLNLDFQDYAVHLGNTLSNDLGTTTTLTTTPSLEPEQPVLVTDSPPLDLEPPSLGLLSPQQGDYVQTGAPFTVALTATDNYTVSSVIVQFDSQGVGAADAPTETITATQTGPNSYSATFPNVAGADGARLVRAIAVDPSGNDAVAAVTVTVSASPPPTSSPTNTATNTSTSTATSTSTSTATKTSTSTSTSTATKTSTNTSVPPTSTPTSTSTSTSTSTNSPTSTATNSPTGTATSTATPTSSPTTAATPTDTAVPTDTSTPTSTRTATAIPMDSPTATATRAPSATSTSRPTSTPTDSPTPAPTATMTPPATSTLAPTDTPTSPPTSTATPTAAPTDTASATSTATAAATGTPAVSATVALRDMDTFDPAVVTIATGGTVTWTNRGLMMHHTVTSDATDGGGQPLWGSGDLAPGDSYSHTFDAPGAYTYHCRYHASQGSGGTWVGMTGTVIVRGAPVATATATATATAAPTNTQTQTPTATTTPTTTGTSTPTGAPTETATATVTAFATSIPTGTPTVTPTETATAASVTPSATASSLPADTATATPTMTASPIPTATRTAMATVTTTPVASPTATMPASLTAPAPTATATAEPTETATATRTPTATVSPPMTTRVTTPTMTPAPTGTLTALPSATMSAMPTRSLTAMATSTATPTATSPTTATSTATLPSGPLATAAVLTGTLPLPLSTFTLTVPAGAAPGPLTLSFTLAPTAPATDGTRVGVAFDLAARDAADVLVHTFALPLTLVVRYDPAALAVSPADLTLVTYDPASGAWVALPTTVDVTAHLLTTTITHLSLVAVQGAPPPTLTAPPAPTQTPLVRVVDVPAAAGTPLVRVVAGATYTPAPSAPPAAPYTPAPDLTAGPTPTARVVVLTRYLDRTRVFVRDCPRESPCIIVQPSVARPGDRLRVAGAGFLPREQVTLALNGAALLTIPTVLTTDGEGRFTAAFLAPGSLLNGPNTVSAIGNRGRRPALAPLTGVLPVAAQVYLAGGFTTRADPAFVDLLNPTRHAAHVRLTFYDGQGATHTMTRLVPPTTHQRLPVARLTTMRGSFGLRVTADQAIVAGLTLTRDGRDGDSIPGNSGLGTRWYLAEGYTGLTFHETVAILNPDARQAAHVRLRLLPLDGGAGRMVPLLVPAHTQRVVDVNRLLPRRSLSIIADADRGVVVERTLTFSSRGYGLTTRSGINVAATSWLFAEGETAHHFQTFQTILNPGGRESHVTARFYGSGGRMLGQRSVVVGARRRANILINDVVRAGGIASVVTADQAIVVERPEYFGSPNDPRVAGSDAYGRNGVGLSWSFAEGETGPHSRELILLYNPSSLRALVEVTAYGADGQPWRTRVSVAPSVRLTLDVGLLFPRAMQVHGVAVAAVNGQGIVAEQTIYAPDLGRLRST